VPPVSFEELPASSATAGRSKKATNNSAISGRKSDGGPAHGGLAFMDQSDRRRGSAEPFSFAPRVPLLLKTLQRSI
jgi:hypothetical protein